MSQTDPLRSLLFAPADAPRKLARAFDSAADVVIADLEDAVASRQKTTARADLCGFMAGAPTRRWAVRINGLTTLEYLDDLVAIIPLAPNYIMLPKCEGPDDLRQLDLQVGALERAAGITRSIGFLPLVSETARGLENLNYRDVSDRLVALVFGAEDLSADLGVLPRDTDGIMSPLIGLARARIAIAAASAGVSAIDTPLPDHRDADAMTRETREASALGYSGKLCIHPAQIPLAHAALATDPDRLGWARAVITAFADVPQSGVAVVHGAMVDKAHLKLANKLVSMSADDD